MRRRAFLRNGALALVGTAAIPQFLVRSVMAEATRAQASGRRLVVLFQRGAADGLNIVVPHGEADYYALRPTIAIAREQVLDLDGRFGLHPALAPLLPLYRAGHLAVVHAVGSPDSTRSHFEAQDSMESGTPGVRNTPDGWLNRALADASAPAPGPASAFRAISVGAQLPRTLAGAFPATAIAAPASFGVGSHPAATAFEGMYAGSGDHLLHAEGTKTFDAVRMLAGTDPARYTPSAGVQYPATPFAASLKTIAQLLKADLGVEAAFADIGDWDTHQNQGGVNGRLANRLRELAGGLAAFWQDLGDGAESVTVVTMSEFGRTAHENGTSGTDHGHGNMMFVLGGRVRGGRVYGPWPGLAPEQLHEGRDLAITTDFRQVLGEAAAHALGVQHFQSIFPGAALSSRESLGLL